MLVFIPHSLWPFWIGFSSVSFPLLLFSEILLLYEPFLQYQRDETLDLPHLSFILDLNNNLFHFTRSIFHSSLYLCCFIPFSPFLKQCPTSLISIYAFSHSSNIAISCREWQQNWHFDQYLSKVPGAYFTLSLSPQGYMENLSSQEELRLTRKQVPWRKGLLDSPWQAFRWAIRRRNRYKTWKPRG